MATTCPKCGAVFPGVQDAFCPECHNKLPEIAPEPKPKEDLQPIPPTDHPPTVSPSSDGSTTPAEDPSQSDNSSIGEGIAFLILFLAGCAFSYYFTRESLLNAYLLSSRGVQADARVTGSKMVYGSRGSRPPQIVERYLHDLEFDGHSGQVVLPKEYPPGTVFQVLYLPEAPEVYVTGSAGDCFYILWERIPARGHAEKFASQLIFFLFLFGVLGIGFAIHQGFCWIGRFFSKLEFVKRELERRPP